MPDDIAAVEPLDPGADARDYPIVARGLVRRFGTIEAVAGIDLAIRPGEVFGFLGPNGAGKSTTVRMLTTLLRPTEGSAAVAGYDVVAEADRVRRSIGVALQDAAIDPLMTGRELLRLQAILHGIPKPDARRRKMELLELVGLMAAADRKVRTYSGGMRRRLDLALALVHEPKVLFLDEPTTGLDPNSRAVLWDEVRKLNRESGATVFLTTQYMEEADQLAGRIAIIDGGKIVAEGTPAHLKSRVGDPTLRVSIVNADDRLNAEKVLLEFGEPSPDTAEYIAVRLAGGAQQVAAVSRALEDAKVEVGSLELRMPTLDDVFQIATGKRLEGAETRTEETNDAGTEVAR
ncbi:MAG: ATP-binding cassette domain-containing protein [Actinomycetota bacterium]|nr:ATP-binding cassette domain-containing protein [Actinomycetota bacterium]